MALLVMIQGPDVGHKYPLELPCTIVGRQFDCTIALQGRAVSRQHAQILLREKSYFVEDLGSSNGTYLNGNKLAPRLPIPLHDGDQLQIGPYTFVLRRKGDVTPSPETLETVEPELIIREKVNALSLNQSIYGPDPATKLKMVLEIAQNLAGTLALEPLLDKLIEQLMGLLPQADRGIIILCQGDRLAVRAQRCRGTQDATTLPFSRTIVRRALEEGVGLLSDDVQADQRFNASETLASLNLHSVLCVPLVNKEGKRLGVIQMDRFRKGTSFKVEDLYLLTTVGMQIAVALENAALHAERLREQRLHQELAMAHDIQEGFLPTELDGFPNPDFEIFGRVHPARQVAGDFYDFFPLPGGRLAFFVGDVSGKGMPAALYMVAVRTLCRHLAKETLSPAQALEKLNEELAAENPSSMFVTLIHGVYHPGTGEVVLASGGHPPPLLRQADGRVEEVPLNPGRLVGLELARAQWRDLRLTLAAGDLLFFFTDGFIEARHPDSKDMFGLPRLLALAQSLPGSRPLPQYTETAKAAIDQFTRSSELQDDATILLLRRNQEKG